MLNVKLFRPGQKERKEKYGEVKRDEEYEEGEKE
jgi:hypothetical protein